MEKELNEIGAKLWIIGNLYSWICLSQLQLSVVGQTGEWKRQTQSLRMYLDTRKRNCGKPDHKKWYMTKIMQIWSVYWKMLSGHMTTEKCSFVYVTGSNSRMLSSDVKTEFRGRGYEIRVHPLSFSEFLKAGQYANELSALQDYMIYGGMPQVVSFSKKKKIISNHCFKGLIYAI